MWVLLTHLKGGSVEGRLGFRGGSLSQAAHPGRAPPATAELLGRRVGPLVRRPGRNSTRNACKCGGRGRPSSNLRSPSEGRPNSGVFDGPSLACCSASPAKGQWLRARKGPAPNPIGGPRPRDPTGDQAERTSLQPRYRQPAAACRGADHHWAFALSQTSSECRSQSIAEPCWFET